MTQQDEIIKARDRIERAISEVPEDILNRYTVNAFDVLAIEDMKGRLLIGSASTIYEYGLARGIRAAKAEARRKRLSQKKGESSC